MESELLEWAKQKAADLLDNACLTQTQHEQGVYSALKADIARALVAAERRGIERAAKVAEGSRSIAQNKWAEGYNEASENIAADIRQIGGEE